MRHYLLVVFLIAVVNVLYAGTEPKFTIIPVVRAPLRMLPNTVATAVYQVTNQTYLTRLLTMERLLGVSQITAGAPGVCANPFLLVPGQSCYLTLRIVANEIYRKRLNNGPRVCKTESDTDNRPDPFLCSQASLGDTLDITVL